MVEHRRLEHGVAFARATRLLVEPLALAGQLGFVDFVHGDFAGHVGQQTRHGRAFVAIGLVQQRERFFVAEALGLCHVVLLAPLVHLGRPALGLGCKLALVVHKVGVQDAVLVHGGLQLGVRVGQRRAQLVVGGVARSQVVQARVQLGQRVHLVCHLVRALDYHTGGRRSGGGRCRG